MLAILEAHKAGLLSRKHWLKNIVAGVIVGVVALPLAMAFAIASGAKPEQGIYTSIVAGLIVAIFGGTRVQIAGPTGAFIVVLSAITAEHGFEGLQIATLMAGVILLLFGLTKMGAVIKFIPAPVILGFTAGIGVIIWVGQWSYFFGLPAATSDYFHQQVWQLLQSFPQLDGTTTLLAFVSLALVIYGPKLLKLERVPGPLIALCVVTALQMVFSFDDVQTIGSAFGGIPLGLPELSTPHITWARMIELIGPAFTIAMLGAIESLLSAVVADGMTGNKHNSNQELIGQGLANMAVPFVGGFAATGAIARTATNIRNGGSSPLAGIVHSLILLIILLLLAPLAASIPLATLAAILFVVAWNMSEVKRFVNMIKRAPTADVVILLITFVLTVFTDLVVAVNIGVILSTLHFINRMSTSVEVRQSTAADISEEFAGHGHADLPDEVMVYSIEGPFFFAATENFERALVHINADPTYLVLRLKWVPFMDITALQTLADVIDDLHKRGVEVMISGANLRVHEKLHKAGIIAKIGEANNFTTFAEVINYFAVTNGENVSV